MTPPPARESTATLCTIDDVRLADVDGATVQAGRIETPRRGDQRETWTLPVTGWVVGHRAAVAQVRATHRDAHWAMPVHDRRPDVAGAHAELPWARYAGFSGALNTLRLPPQFELQLTVQLEDGTRAPLGTIGGRRTPLQSSYDPELRPLIVTTLGRTGSTWLIHLLAGHPAVTAYRPFSFEPRAVTYWIDVLTSLSEPASYTQQVEGEVHYPHPWWLGSGTRMTSEVLPDSDLARWLGSEHVTDLAAFAQQRLDAVYLRVGALEDDRPEFFAEKCLPESNVPQLVQELYPDGREIFLVRDFRDMLCSIRAFNERRGSSAFGLDGSGGEETYVLDVLAPSVQNLLHEWRDRADKAQLVRYEDLILDPAGTLRGVLGRAGLEASTERVDDMLARAAVPIPGMAVHRTAGEGAADSVGRWRRDLEPRLQAVCDEAFAGALAEFGYEPPQRVRVSGMALSEISAVELYPAAGEDLWGFHVDSPLTGAAHDAYAFDVRGWVLGRRERVTAVELKDGPRLLWRVPAEIARPELAEQYPKAQDTGAAGFFTIVNSLNLGQEFEIVLRARLDDASRVTMATLRGRRERLRTAFEPAINPLMVTTLGRTGSTILMKVLATHPEIVAYRPFEHEPRVISYWLGVMNALTDPVSYRRQINPTGNIDGSWWLGNKPPLPRRLRNPHLTRWLDVDAVGEIATFCQGRIEAVYREAAADAGIGSARYFAEKVRPDRVPVMTTELYPRAREVILVRDFRDMVASMFAYNAKRGREGFRRDLFNDDATYVVEQIKGAVASVAAAWEARRESAHLIRYEDLVLDPQNTVEALLRYLGLETGEHTEAMVAALFARDPETESHRTTPDPRASIGRWKDDLSEGAQRTCEEALAAELKTFGYTLEEAAA